MSEMTDEEITKALARMMLTKFEVFGKKVCTSIDGKSFPFNPITDGNINLMIRDEFEVEVDYEAKEVSVYGDSAVEWVALSTVPYTTKGEIKRAVCIAVVEAHK